METYEDVKKFLAECRMDGNMDHPNQKTWINGFPYWHCTNWEEFVEAMIHCSCPAILGSSYSFGEDKTFTVDIYDNFIWNNKDYRWPTGEQWVVVPGYNPSIVERKRDICYVGHVMGSLETIVPCWECPIENPRQACHQCNRETREVYLQEVEE